MSPGELAQVGAVAGVILAAVWLRWEHGRPARSTEEPRQWWHLSALWRGSSWRLWAVLWAALGGYFVVYAVAYLLGR